MKTTGDALRDVAAAIDALKDAVIIGARNDLMRMIRDLGYIAKNEDARTENLVEHSTTLGRCDSCGSVYVVQDGEWICPIGCSEA